MESRLAIYDTVTPVETSTSPLVTFIVLYLFFIVKNLLMHPLQFSGIPENLLVSALQNAWVSR